MTTRPHILIAESDGYDPEAVALYRSLGTVAVEPTGTRAGLLAALKDCTILVVRLRHRLDREAMDHAPNLRAIVTPTTGLNHLDLDEANRRGILVLSLRGETDFLRTIPATAELTWGLILALIRRIPQAAASVREGCWDRDAFRGRDMDGRVLGIVGMGRIGFKVAGYGLAFGMKVQATDPAPLSLLPGVTMCSLAELLREADIVSLHVPLMPSTTGMIGPAEFAQMKRGACLVNTSRGEVIDETAFARALEDGVLAGAAVDVLGGERGDDPSWLQRHPLAIYARTHDNLIITPHIGGATSESMAATEVYMARQLCRWARAAHRKESP